MASYISSNANRFYAAIEPSYGQAALVSAANRFPAVSMAIQQGLEQSRRHDKTGSRTFRGTPKTSRRVTAFETQTYLTSWDGTGSPAYGPLFQAALGGQPLLNGGPTIQSVPQAAAIQTTAPHGLTAGSAVSFNNEIRFVASVVDAQTVLLNAGFSATPSAGSGLTPAITYRLSTNLPSVTLYDYWDPITAVQRAVVGVAVDTLDVSVNGDFHEFTFRGPAADVLDSQTFSAGTAGLSQFPAEPPLGSFDYSLVPGHLGQAWIGTPANQFFTLITASIRLNNNLTARNREFGTAIPRAISPGARHVLAHLSVLAQDDAQTTGLFQAARSRTALPAMLQLGQQQGQLMGIYMPSVTPELPRYNDGQPELQWDFQNCQAQGQADDEIFIAFA